MKAHAGPKSARIICYLKQITGTTNPFDTPAYLEKFGLKEPPYTTNPDERYLYLTETHEEAIHMCGRLISNREGAGLIVGEQGTGKTTIMRRLHSLMQSHGQFQVSIIETAEHCPSLFQLSKEILDRLANPASRAIPNHAWTN